MWLLFCEITTQHQKQRRKEQPVSGVFHYLKQCLIKRISCEKAIVAVAAYTNKVQRPGQNKCASKTQTSFCRPCNSRTQHCRRKIPQVIECAVKYQVLNQLRQEVGSGEIPIVDVHRNVKKYSCGIDNRRSFEECSEPVRIFGVSCNQEKSRCHEEKRNGCPCDYPCQNKVRCFAE